MAEDHSQELLKELAEIIADPVLFVTIILNQILRSYQMEIIKHPAIRKVLRLGRRMGKTFTMACRVIWYACAHEGARVLIACPFDSQVEALFSEIRRLITAAPMVQQWVVTDRQEPQRIGIQLRPNGPTSWIRGFTTGVKSGTDAASARGQGADLIIMDEQDYMSEGDFTTLISLTIENPHKIEVWCASTPTGRRSTFWKLCTDSSIAFSPERMTGWKEFHFPATMHPNWDENLEAELRAQYPGELQFMHEVLAEFGDEESGVFRKQAIASARSNYQYFRLDQPIPNGIRTMGVDWDKAQAGTSILVMEWDDSLTDEVGNPTPKFRVVHREEVQKGEWTYDLAVKRIIILNEKFKPKFIYVDKGYGEYQVEMLRRWGQRHPESGLEKKVKAIQFGQHIEVRDPINGKIDKKPVKPFMVTQLEILLDRNQLLLSNDDDVVWRQLQNYRVKSISAAGLPIYSATMEHVVDCLGLATLAFTLELPELTRIVLSSRNSSIIRRSKLPQPMLESMSSDSRADLPKWWLDWDEPVANRPLVPVSGSRKFNGINGFSRGGSTRSTTKRRSF